MAYTNIDDPSAFFQTLVYTGNGSNPRNLTNDGNSDLKPDWIWGKNLTDNGSNHAVQISNLSFDAPTNSTQVATDNSSNANSPATTYGYCSASLTDGFTAAAGGTNGDTRNADGKEFACWQWKCNGGTVANNTDGTITTSVQANSTAGFSIGTYTGDGNAAVSIGHGLGAIPDFFMIKGYSGSGTKYWVVGCPNTAAFGNGGSNHVFLDTTNAIMSNTTIWRNANFTSTIVPLGSHQAINHVSSNYMFFAFKNVQGYSKIGQYLGNGNGSNGPFIYTGFKPAWVMIKNLDATQVWILFDSGRTPFNRDDAVDSIYPSETSAEYVGASYHGVDMMSNGFKVKLTDAAVNTSGADYLYMAFAESPFVTSTGIPTTAR